MPALKPLTLAIGLLLGGQALAAPVFDVTELGDPATACSDLDTFVNQKWVAANPIPPDKSRWGSFMALGEKSLNDQHAILRRAARTADRAAAGSVEQKIGWLYRSGMDEAAIERAGYRPIQAQLAAIDGLRTTADVVKYLQQSFARGDMQVFSFGSGADYQNAKQQIAYAYQGGLGLPTPDYYTEADYAKLRQAYLGHIARLLVLTGVPKARAAVQAELVLAFESRLARASVKPVELRNPENQYHYLSFAEANQVTPHFDWQAFFASQGVTGQQGFSLSQPGFFAEFDRMLAETPVEQWQAYLRAHVIDDAAPLLSRPFQQESFEFNQKTLSGQQQQSERSKRVLRAVNGAMGEGLGQLYVQEHFSPQAKARAQELVDNVMLALKARIEQLDWMSPETKQKALAKWDSFLPKIGYPERWRDWSGLTLQPQGFYANLEAASRFNYRHDLDKIGKPTDRKEWGMYPQTVNAYYSPTDNTINFPAAILQPPFFYPDGDDAINYGGIGAVIGHEASHGFDDQGSKFDGAGNQVDWWTPADRKAFEARTGKLVQQFDGYRPLPDHPELHVNGKLTLGENIGDLGGINAAYDALQLALAKKPEEAARKIDGYTQDQRFFLNWARVWRGSIREEQARLFLNTDPHAPMRFRAIGAPSNMPAFAQAFSCKAGDAMVRPDEQRVEIW